MPVQKLNYESNKSKGMHSTKKQSMNVLSLPQNEYGNKKMIGPSNRWNNIQCHYETMNNKENFGGDMDDIEEMSEFIDDNSKFVYTSEEDNNSQGDSGNGGKNVNYITTTIKHLNFITCIWLIIVSND